MTATVAVHKVLLVLQGRAKPRIELQIGSAQWDQPQRPAEWSAPGCLTPHTISSGTPTLPPQVMSLLFLRNNWWSLKQDIKQLLIPLLGSSFSAVSRTRRHLWSYSSACLEIWGRCKLQTGQQLSSALGTSAVDQLSCQKQTLLGLEGFLEPKNMGLIQKSKKFVETLLLWVLNPSQRAWGSANLSFKNFYSVGFLILFFFWDKCVALE